MTRDISAIVHHPSALWALISVGFLYGIVHAAGPGHGKALLTSYMMASEEQRKRGLLLAMLAAFLQGLVAVVLVGICALLLHWTAPRMTMGANRVAGFGDVGMILIGAWLIGRKGWTLYSVCRHKHVHHSGCGHSHTHAEDSHTAWATVLAAGMRPCSGSLLVLVFALANDIFWAGVAAVAAISLGTALTTRTLAWLAVFAKTLALRFARGETRWGRIIALGCELLVGLTIFCVGLALFSQAFVGA